MKKAIIWGTGKYGTEAYEYLLSSDEYEIIGVCDNSEEKIGTDFYGHRVSGIKEIMDDGVSFDIILLCAKRWDDMLADPMLESMDIDMIRCWNGRDVVCLEDSFCLTVTSQDGEELYLRERFKRETNGTYVDVGAYHPVRFSNTLWFYKKGWRGINIEPNPDIIELFRKLRPRDININCGISDNKGRLKYYQFEEAAINTFDAKRVVKLAVENGVHVKKTTEISVVPLSEILLENGIKYINFLDIDVEDHELEVLKSIDFAQVEIDCIMVEQLDNDLKGVLRSKESKYLSGFGFVPVSKFNRTVFYEKKSD